MTNPKRIPSELIIDPKIITKLSLVSGCGKTRRLKAEDFNMAIAVDEIDGDWDLTNRGFEGDFRLFKTKQRHTYNWKPLYKSIKKRGYIQDPSTRYIEVAIGRTGEIFLVDGRHRLLIAQDLGIPEIPVDVVYTHPEYKFTNLQVMKNKVIPKAIHNRIARLWNKDTPVYQFYGTIKSRFEFIAKHLPILKGSRVLEIGPNAGMMIWSIMQHAESYIGLERHAEYFEQCHTTIRCIEALWWGKITEVLFTSLQGFYPDIVADSVEFDALVASFVLYHMNAMEIEILKNEILPKCKKVIIPTRTKERKSNINNLYLNRENTVSKLFIEAGFDIKVDRNKEDGYFVLVGEKP